MENTANNNSNTNNDTKNIVICMSADTTVFSGMTYFLDGGGFTHASLGLSEESEYYYSFNFKGMTREYRTSLAKRPRKMVRYIVEVPSDAHAKLTEIVEDMYANREQVRYSRSKVALRLLGLKNREEKHDKYYCSEFICEALKESGCIPINISTANCTPNDLLNELEKSGQIKDVYIEKELENPAEHLVGKVLDKVEGGHEKLKEMMGSLCIGSDSGDPESPDNDITFLKQTADTLSDIKTALGEIPENIAKVTGGLMKKGSEKLSQIMHDEED